MVTALTTQLSQPTPSFQTQQSRSGYDRYLHFGRVIILFSTLRQNLKFELMNQCYFIPLKNRIQMDFPVREN